MQKEGESDELEGGSSHHDLPSAQPAKIHPWLVNANPATPLWVRRRLQAVAHFPCLMRVVVESAHPTRPLADRRAAKVLVDAIDRGSPLPLILAQFLQTTNEAVLATEDLPLIAVEGIRHRRTVRRLVHCLGLLGSHPRELLLDGQWRVLQRLVPIIDVIADRSGLDRVTLLYFALEAPLSRLLDHVRDARDTGRLLRRLFEAFSSKAIDDWTWRGLAISVLRRWLESHDASGIREDAVVFRLPSGWKATRLLPHLSGFYDPFVIHPFLLDYAHDVAWGDADAFVLCRRNRKPRIVVVILPPESPRLVGSRPLARLFVKHPRRESREDVAVGRELLQALGHPRLKIELPRW